MSVKDRWWLRIGVLTDLVVRSQTRLGRTALMKLAYLLQTVKGVPLGYNFRLYTYGPFDEDVLNDLGQAESMQAVVSKMIPFGGGTGYGYEFVAGPSADRVRGRLEDKISKYQGELQWAIDRFGSLSAADLELLSTIVYADRDSFARAHQGSLDELTKLVLEIKPRFSAEYVRQCIRQLQESELILALCH